MRAHFVDIFCNQSMIYSERMGEVCGDAIEKYGRMEQDDVRDTIMRLLMNI